ncbi:MAG: FkbM family methyltransferase [Alphaproteobacteria bacterium]|nr:FkbM family methyltransferase [Alphaproteobacteria bacterium]
MKLEYGYYFPDDETHFQSFLAHGDYQILQREMGVGVCRAINIPLNCALDIGAHVGLWARPLSTVFKKVICFEPRKENVECLRKNLADRNAIIYPFGLSDTITQKSFYMPGDVHNSGAGSFGTFENRSATSTTADLKTLDSIKISEINFIKMDVQGWELNVVRGGVETLRRMQPVILCENEPVQEGLVELLAQLGYEKILRVVKEDIFVPTSLLSKDARTALMSYFNERKSYFESLI